MPQPTSVTLMPVKNIDSLGIGDLIVFRGRLYRIFSIPKQNSPQNPSLQMEVVWGKADDTQQGWRYLETLMADNALKLTIT